MKKTDELLADYFDELMRFAYERNVFNGGYGVLVRGAVSREEVVRFIFSTKKAIEDAGNNDYPAPPEAVAHLLV
jgi:hypothetical protein